MIPAADYYDFFERAAAVDADPTTLPLAGRGDDALG